MSSRRRGSRGPVGGLVVEGVAAGRQAVGRAGPRQARITSPRVGALGDLAAGYGLVDAGRPFADPDPVEAMQREGGPVSRR